MLKKSTSRTQKQLVAENEDLRARLDEAEETLRAIGSGEVDALVVSGVDGEQLFTLKGADHSYRILIENMGEGALTLTAEGVILYANRRFAEMLKTPLEKVIGSTIHTWVAPDSQQILQSLLIKGADEKRREQLVLTASDGTPVPASLSVGNLPINEMPDCLFLVATDLTEQKRSDAIAASEKLAQELLAASNQSRLALQSVIEDQKRAEESQRQSEENFRRSLDDCPLGVRIVTAEGETIYANRVILDINSCNSLEELKTTPAENRYTPESFAEHQIRKEKRKRGDYDPSEYDISIVRKDGELRHLQVFRKEVLWDGERQFQVLYNDITDRKRVEEALRESEENYRNLFENANQAIFVVQDDKVVFLNPVSTMMIGYSGEEIMARPFIEFIHPDDRDMVIDRYIRRMKGEELPHLYSFRIIHRDGNIRWVELNAVLINWKGKTATLNFLTDITDRRKAEEELKISREHVAMINKILRHDLINDLSVIRSALRLYGETREERLLKEASGRVGKSVDLIRSMKELEIFISSRRDLKLYNIGSTIKEVMKSYSSIRFTIEGKGQVLADEALSSVIDNIIANATIHGKADRVEIKIEKARDMCEIRIADNGIGIPDEIKGRIFEENFVFGEDAHTGVGLHIVKNTIENYGGSVRVEDNTPKGAVFVLKMKGVK
ncbi:MAG: PAS domain S-box protein [Syntrophales bacterium]|nr:PAS domain S-box protein [Syntrophales bacterium]